ncbi:MAG: carbon storage regulator [Planctomycetia bacterium]|nr:carbon storage regulator [Planctomycetia bacterium]
MLVLTRKLDQQIQIGEGIVVTVLQVKGNSVKIGISAPRDVRVLRGELEPKNEEAPERKMSPVDTTARSARLTDEERMMFVNPSPNYASAERLRPNTNDRTLDRMTDRLGEARDASNGRSLMQRVAESPLRGLTMARR